MAHRRKGAEEDGLGVRVPEHVPGIHLGEEDRPVLVGQGSAQVAGRDAQPVTLIVRLRYWVRDQDRWGRIRDRENNVLGRHGRLPSLVIRAGKAPRRSQVSSSHVSCIAPRSNSMIRPRV